MWKGAGLWRDWESQRVFPGITPPWEGASPCSGCGMIPDPSGSARAASAPSLLPAGGRVPLLAGAGAGAAWRRWKISSRPPGRSNGVTSAHQWDTGTARGLNWAGGAFLGNPLPTASKMWEYWEWGFPVSASAPSADPKVLGGFPGFWKNSLGKEGWENEGEQDSFGSSHLDQER